MQTAKEYILKQLIKIKNTGTESMINMAKNVKCICNMDHEVLGFHIVLNEYKILVELETYKSMMTGTIRHSYMTMMLEDDMNQEIFEHYKNIFEKNRWFLQ